MFWFISGWLRRWLRYYRRHARKSDDWSERRDLERSELGAPEGAGMAFRARIGGIVAGMLLKRH